MFSGKVQNKAIWPLRMNFSAFLQVGASLVPIVVLKFESYCFLNEIVSSKS